jgi:hypothetical protein
MPHLDLQISSAIQREKTRPTGDNTAPGHYIKKKPFSRRSRKPPNPPIHSGTVAHVRNDGDRDRVLDLCFGVGQTRRFFLTTT